MPEATALPTERVPLFAPFDATPDLSSSLLVPALVLALLAIACSASCLAVGSRRGASGAARAAAVCIAAAACLPVAAAAPEGLPSLAAFSWLADGALPILVATIVVIQGLAILALAVDRKATRAPPAGPVSAPPSPPEPDAGGTSYSVELEPSVSTKIDLGDIASTLGGAEGSIQTRLEALDENKDNKINSAELIQLMNQLRMEEKEKEKARKRGDWYKKAFVMALLFIVVLFGSTFASSLTAVFVAKDTRVGADNTLVSSDTGEVLKTGSALFDTMPYVAPGAESEQAVTEWHQGPNATTATVLVDARGGAVATAAATDNNSVLVDANGGVVAAAAATDKQGVLIDAGGAPVKTESAEYEARFGGSDLSRFLLGASRKRLKGLKTIAVSMPEGMSAEFAVIGWSSQSFAVLPPTDDAGDSQWALSWSDAGALVNSSNPPLSLHTVLLEFQTSSFPHHGLVAFSLSDPLDARAEPLLSLSLVSQADLGRVGALISPLPSTDEGEDASANLNYIMTQMVLKGRPFYFDPAQNNSLVDGRRQLWLDDLASFVVSTGQAIGDFFEDAVEAVVDTFESVVCTVGSGLANVVETVVTSVITHIIEPVTEFACDLITAPIETALVSLGEMCIEPVAPCFPDSMNAETPVEVFRAGNEANELTVSAKVDFKACAHVKEADIDCGGLVSFLASRAAQWANDHITGPARDFLTTYCPQRRRLAEGPEKYTVIHDIATAAVQQESGGHGRLMTEFEAAVQNGTSEAFSRRLIAKATVRALELTRQRFVDAVVEEQKAGLRRRLQNSDREDYEDAVSKGAAVKFGQIKLVFSLKAGITLVAEATSAIEEYREVDLFELLSPKKEPLSLDTGLNIPVAPGLLSFGFDIGAKFRFPLAVQATFAAAGRATAKIIFDRSWTFSTGGSGSGDQPPTWSGWSETDDSEIGFAASGGASASLSAKIGFNVEVSLRISATLASSLTLYGEAAVRWEVMGGADAAACVTGAVSTGSATARPFQCTSLETKLTPYVEYTEALLDQAETDYDAATASSSASGYAAVGVWLYATYPQISLGVGWNLFGIQGLLSQCLEGVPDKISWSSSFGSHDTSLGEAHPFGGFIFWLAHVEKVSFEFADGADGAEASHTVTNFMRLGGEPPSADPSTYNGLTGFVPFNWANNGAVYPARALRYHFAGPAPPPSPHTPPIGEC